MVTTKKLGQSERGRESYTTGTKRKRDAAKYGYGHSTEIKAAPTSVTNEGIPALHFRQVPR